MIGVSFGDELILIITKVYVISLKAANGFTPTVSFDLYDYSVKSVKYSHNFIYVETEAERA